MLARVDFSPVNGVPIATYFFCFGFEQLNSFTVSVGCTIITLLLPCPFGKWNLPKGDVDGTTICCPFEGVAGRRDGESGGVARHVAALGTIRVFTKSVPLDSWFKFQAADTYRITATYHLELYNPNDATRPLWQDFAVGECQVRVENRLFVPIVEKKE